MVFPGWGLGANSSIQLDRSNFHRSEARSSCFFPMKCYTHPKCNMGRDNHPFGEENHFPNHHLWNAMLVFRSVLGLHHCLQACSKEYGGPHPSLCMFLYVWPHFAGNFVTCNIQGTLSSRWWFQIVFIFALTWGNDPLWRIFFKWVETWNTNKISCCSNCHAEHFGMKILFDPAGLQAKKRWSKTLTESWWSIRVFTQNHVLNNLLFWKGLLFFLCWLWCFPFGCQK